MEYRRLSDLLITNWGHADSRTGDLGKFRLCPDCGRHLEYDISNPAQAGLIQKWRENHLWSCSGELVPLVLGYEFQADCLILNLPAFHDTVITGIVRVSPSLVTLTEALVGGAADLLELESFELAGFPRVSPPDAATDEIVFYETVPGGAGYVEEMARRLPEVARAAREWLYGHPCMKGCYLCLKHYYNQRWHGFLEKTRVQDVLFQMTMMDSVNPSEGSIGDGDQRLRDELSHRRSQVGPGSSAPGEA